ncbi:zinc finger protein 184 isoform X3 [Cyclopterus lumpus]|uniref:zinc finger protein 184 isoform X3 n=1 Tax=Cyclopterus lumpus TaxID=8103 RepID=UPI001485D451|nr:zinc finger protein 184 isoform X3 [Cyclopterus lumpus]
MDAAAASAIKEDGAGDEPRDGDTPSGNDASPSAEDTAERIFCCRDCGEGFREESAYLEHQHQHPQEINRCSIVCKDCGLRFTHWDVFQTHLHQHALEDEEEEAAQTGDDMRPAADLDSRNAGDGGDTDGDADECDTSRSLQTNPSGFTQDVDGAAGSAKTPCGSIHSCLICGKVYTYWVSFRKHLRLHEKMLSKGPESSVQNLISYQCPECGMSFIRRARLLDHLRVHSSFTSKPPKCDQCNKDFISVQSWLAHVDFHKQNPFWCSSCATGFKEEHLLDKHVQDHNRMEYKCKICLKSFGKSEQLRIHYNSHSRVKPFQCTFCEKSFSHPKNLFSHRKKHLGVHVGSSEIKNSANIAKDQVIETRILARVKEEREMDTNPEVLDCGEPVHHATISKAPESAESIQSETERPPTAQEANVRSEHKVWEWECVECDMGFDDMAELHLHYIKHATGEIPMQSMIEG